MQCALGCLRRAEVCCISPLADHPRRRGRPSDHREPLLWKLITNLKVTSFEQAVHKLEWYARRWSIETFFKTLKTGCRIEDIRLTTADRLANCIALACVTAWRISWMTWLRRAAPASESAAIFTDTEITLLDRTAPEPRSGQMRDLDFYIVAVAPSVPIGVRHSIG